MKNPFSEFYEQIILNPQKLLYPIVQVLAMLLAAGLTWWIYNKVIGRIEKRYEGSLFLEKSGRIFVLVKRAGHYLILILVGTGLLNLFQSPMAQKIFYAFMIILLASIACSIVNSLIPYLERNIADKTTTKVDDVIVDLSRKFSGIVIYGVGIIMALDKLGLNVMPFVAGAGVAGIAIGFAAKDTLSNIIAGVLMIIDRPLRVGDRIEVWSAPKNSSTWGDVIHIGLRATKIRTTDNIVSIVPNNEIMNRDIINYTAVTDEIRVRIPIGIAYDANINKAKEIIVKVSLELDWVMKDPAPMVVVRSFGDSSVDLQARIWIRNPRRRMDTISYITDRVKEEFDKAGIEIPYPKRDIYIKKES